jgi:hypothetical protein
MTQNNVGALVVVKPGEEKSIAGIITERGNQCSCTYFFGTVICCLMGSLVINLNVPCAVKSNMIYIGEEKPAK